jgi:hypothetical protein
MAGAHDVSIPRTRSRASRVRLSASSDQAAGRVRLPGLCLARPGGEAPHTAEFCENGAKAVAEETTLRRVDPGFFAEHSAAELAERTDFWLG